MVLVLGITVDLGTTCACVSEAGTNNVITFLPLLTSPSSQTLRAYYRQ
jgi:hypothetical protein